MKRIRQFLLYIILVLSYSSCVDYSIQFVPQTIDLVEIKDKNKYEIIETYTVTDYNYKGEITNEILNNYPKFSFSLRENERLIHWTKVNDLDKEIQQDLFDFLKYNNIYFLIEDTNDKEVFLLYSISRGPYDAKKKTFYSNFFKIIGIIDKSHKKLHLIEWFR